MSMTASRIVMCTATLILAVSASGGEAPATVDGFWLCQNIQSSTGRNEGA